MGRTTLEFRYPVSRRDGNTPESSWYHISRRVKNIDKVGSLLSNSRKKLLPTGWYGVKGRKKTINEE